METAWFNDWISKHMSYFGLPESDEKTLLSWRELFEKCGYSIQELSAATDTLAADPSQLLGEARFQGRLVAHLEAIQRVIREQRSVQYRRDVDEHEHDPGICCTCGGSGYVIVPHLKGIQNGAWVAVRCARGGASYYTQAVFCSCPLGMWVRDHREGDKPITLETYQLRNPGWRGQIRQRQEQQLARAALQPKDPLFTEAIKRLIHAGRD